MRDLARLGVKWYQNYAMKDDLVTPPCALAGNKFVGGTDVIETVAFPGGHVAILTSPYSKKAPVNGTFVDATGRSAGACPVPARGIRTTIRSVVIAQPLIRQGARRHPV
jgi:hypothetical protein